MTVQSTAHPDTSGRSLHVVVRTRQARMLLQGRGKGGGRHIPGLQKFAGQAWGASRMSARDDPFADYALVQVETGYREVVKRLRETRIRHSDRWRQTCSGPAVSTVPAVRFRAVSMQIRFSTYADMALALIQQVDAVVCMLQAMNRLELLKSGDAYREIDILVSRIRCMMSEVGSWAPTGYTRRDLLERNDRALASVEWLAGRGFIDRSMFNGLHDMCGYFGRYAYHPELALTIDAEAVFGVAGA